VTLAATLLNEGRFLREWWNSILRQTRFPDELVVVDGGSCDGTPLMLRELSRDAPFPVKVEVLPGCNIARGRNHAVRISSHPLVAVTDGGCVLHPRWLENLVRPLEEDPGIQLAAGFYQPLEGSWFQAVSACVTLPLVEEVRGDRFMPSSRSVAFRREVWEQVGGYPEWLDIGEDMYFNHAWRRMGVRHVFVPDALVYWAMREDPVSLFRQYFRYARGDGEAGMYPHRHLVRFGVYAWSGFVLASRRRSRLLAPTAAAGLFYVGRRWARIPRYLGSRGPLQKAAAVPAVPVLLLLVDVAKMAGYLEGLRVRAAAEAGKRHRRETAREHDG
jgi:cellulose synthase/poly-beta-1,6-N-acetylglucosamine synthase-like glycosyltransferase